MEVLMTATGVEERMKMRQSGKSGIGWTKRARSDCRG